MKPAQRMETLTTHFFAALRREVQVLQASGQEVIRLDEGNPDLPPAAHILAALERAAQRPEAHGYQPHRGPEALRQAWADFYRNRFGVILDPEREVLPLLGSKEGIFHLSLAFVDPGDYVLVPDPGYVTYTRGALFAGGRIFPLPIRRENHYLPDLDAIPKKVLQHTRLLWLNYPNNPTAATASLDFFTQAVALAQRYNFLLCHDAAYACVSFEGEQPPSLLQAPGAEQVAVEFNSLSKSHNMAGWRSGVLVGNAGVLQALFTLKTNADSGHFLPIWEASIAALRGDQSWLAERNETYRQRRDVVVQSLRALGLEVASPRASLYVWSPVPRGWRSAEFALALLRDCGVSLTPGTVFGPGGEGYLRISLTAPVARIRQAMERLAAWTKAKRIYP